ncbi:chemotaxis protein CheD [Flammeovirgaceae bacterium SG7u.111]|nr:chemotaxis protein CheD [Flammeovirgaceae bacterium SG7u.132]WPO33390.1 chemotaxis protein CheD [Flammeovirgaceae bacterium SG7u.111]
MNHFMLPKWNGEGIACPKYGNIATVKMVSRMERLGANRKKIIAKIFGGQESPNSIYDIGKRNSVIAEVMLKELKTKIIVKQVGGIQSRKVVFDTFTGDVYMKYI